MDAFLSAVEEPWSIDEGTIRVTFGGEVESMVSGAMDPMMTGWTVGGVIL